MHTVNHPETSVVIIITLVKPAVAGPGYYQVAKPTPTHPPKGHNGTCLDFQIDAMFSGVESFVKR
jgi:hypothetical protein